MPATASGLRVGLALRPSRDNLVDCERALNDAVSAPSAVWWPSSSQAAAPVKARGRKRGPLQQELLRLQALLGNASNFHQTIGDIIALDLSGYDKTGPPDCVHPGVQTVH